MSQAAAEHSTASYVLNCATKKILKAFYKGLKHPSSILAAARCCFCSSTQTVSLERPAGGQGDALQTLPGKMSAAHPRQGPPPETSSALQADPSPPLSLHLSASINNGWRGCKKDLQWLGERFKVQETFRGKGKIQTHPY